MAQTEGKTDLFHHPLDYLNLTVHEGARWLHERQKTITLTATLLGTAGLMTFLQMRSSIPTVSEGYTPIEHSDSLLRTTESDLKLETLPKPNEILVPESSIEKTTKMLEDLHQNISMIREIRNGWTNLGIPYHVEAGDTLESIAEKNHTTVEKILNLEPHLNQQKLFAGEVFLIPKSQDPSPYMTKIFNDAEKDLAELKRAENDPSKDSSETETLAKDIYKSWTAAPKQTNPIKPPKIVIDHQAQNTEVIISEINKIVDLIPNIGLLVDQISVDHWNILPDYSFPMFMTGSENKGAHIVIRDSFSKDGKQQWIIKKLDEDIIHEIGHGGSIYGNAEYIATLIPKAELINFALEDTKILDKRVKLINPDVHLALIEDEENSWLIQKEPSSDPFEMEVYQERTAFNNKWYSKLLGKEVNFSEIAKN